MNSVASRNLRAEKDRKEERERERLLDREQKFRSYSFHTVSFQVLPFLSLLSFLRPFHSFNSSLFPSVPLSFSQFLLQGFCLLRSYYCPSFSLSWPHSFIVQRLLLFTSLLFSSVLLNPHSLASIQHHSSLPLQCSFHSFQSSIQSIQQYSDKVSTLNPPFSLSNNTLILTEL